MYLVTIFVSLLSSLSLVSFVFVSGFFHSKHCNMLLQNMHFFLKPNNVQGYWQTNMYQMQKKVTDEDSICCSVCGIFSSSQKYTNNKNHIWECSRCDVHKCGKCRKVLGDCSCILFNCCNNLLYKKCSELDRKKIIVTQETLKSHGFSNA